MVWFNSCIPRHAFNLWLIVKRKFKTQDMIRAWDVSDSLGTSCALCDMTPDSHEHLFFNCTFSQAVWSHMVWLTGFNLASHDIYSLISSLQPDVKRRTTKSVIVRLVIAASAYFVWQERNWRLFKSKKRTVVLYGMSYEFWLFKLLLEGKPQHDDNGFVDSGCSRHMTGNIAYLSDFKQFDGGYVAFGGGAYGGKILGKGNLQLEDVDDEAVHKELGDKMERAATNASSLEAEQDSGSGPRCQDIILWDMNAQTRFEITSIQSIDPPLSRGYTLGSGEDSMKLIGIDGILWITEEDAENAHAETEERNILIQLPMIHYPVVLDLEKAKSDQAVEIASLKKREDASKQGRSIEDIDADVEVTLVNEQQNENLMFDTEVLDDDEVFVDVASIGGELEEDELARKQEEEANIALIESWENTQAMMEADRLLAERLQSKEREELTDEEKGKLFMELMEKRRKHFA
ncbi:reverse transcriptase domain, reverse transcriptase zinc-binding domain protein [Tanacetum coccineum]